MVKKSETKVEDNVVQPKRSIVSQWCCLYKKLVGKNVPLVAVLRLSGVIMSAGHGGMSKRGLNLDGLEGDIERAFRLSKTHLKAVVLQINSPGGSPVQSELIYQRIRQLSQEKSIPVYSFVEDAAASGGYWLACAGDEIFATQSSIVGSIGVISSGFGFTEAIKKLGIERRVHTVGESKSILDPFQSEKKKDVDILMAAANDMHEGFKTVVRERRKIVKKNEKRLFSGEFWSGVKAKELGLIDDIGEMRQVMRERYGTKVKLIKVNRGEGWFKRRVGLSLDHVIDSFYAVLEERSWWGMIGK